MYNYIYIYIHIYIYILARHQHIRTRTSICQKQDQHGPAFCRLVLAGPVKKLDLYKVFHILATSWLQSEEKAKASRKCWSLLVLAGTCGKMLVLAIPN